jgi:hypothetical protein
MGKKRTKKRGRNSSEPQAKGSPRGFDFGCLPRALALGSTEFPRQLGEAAVVAVAYGTKWSDDLGGDVPCITLVAQREQFLIDAFTTFADWAHATDPDSLALTVVLRSDGGYLLALSPESQRLEQRCLGFDRTHVAITYSAIWVKRLDTVHPFLRRFRDYVEGPVAPFILDGAVYTGSPSAPPSPSYVRQLSGISPLLKFEATVVNEADVQPGTMAALALAVASSEASRKSREDPPTRSPLQVVQQRVKSLRTHFPVTLERCRSSEAIATLVSELAPTGIRAWQVEQALCNLVLSRSICNDLHYRCLSASKLGESVLAALGDRYEVADGQGGVDATAGDLQVQVLADTNALLRCFKERSAKTIDDGLEALRRASLLDAPTAGTDLPPSWRVAP